MQTFCLVLAFGACLVAADVSHLSSRYLPPAASAEHAVATTIEQQELRELPEQVEYMRGSEMGAMEQSMLMPPMPPMEETRENAELQPEMMPMEQAKMAAMEEQQPAMDSQYMQPAMHYLPPQEMQMQPNYQQYQEELLRSQMAEKQQRQPEEEQMPYVMDVQQPMAPSDMQSSSDLEAEAEPAHELRNDGYHYRMAEEEQRLRH